MILERPAWQADAACRGVDPSMFYPESRGDSIAAENICKRCPVRLLCLDYALAHREKEGVWGGLNERKRRRLIAERRRSDAATKEVA
jgi:WhiB family transcriptional regulator, redox-sensing transcriptional regulator